MRDWKDRLGIFASAACAVHCAATPFLVAALPTLKLTEWMTDPRFHQVVAVLCCSLVAVAIVPTALRFRDLRLLSLASAGLGLIVTAAFLVPDTSCCSLHATSPAASDRVDADPSAHDPSAHDPSAHDHSAHDHSAHDHSAHDHSAHDHSAHDHSAHDHSGHDHSGHDHSSPGHSHLEDHDSQADSPTLMMAGITVAQPWMTPVGGLLLMVAHGLNMRRRGKSACGHLNCCTTSQDVELLKLPDQRSGETSFARAS